MDKATVEFMCGSRGAPDIVTALTKDIEEFEYKPGMKATLIDMLGATVDCLVALRDTQKLKLNFKAIRENTGFDAVIALTYNPDIPLNQRKQVIRYLRELQHFPPGAVDSEGKKKPPEETAKFNLSTPKKQHEGICEMFLKPAAAAGLS